MSRVSVWFSDRGPFGSCYYRITLEAKGIFFWLKATGSPSTGQTLSVHRLIQGMGYLPPHLYFPPKPH